MQRKTQPTGNLSPALTAKARRLAEQLVPLLRECSEKECELATLEKKLFWQQNHAAGIRLNRDLEDVYARRNAVEEPLAKLIASRALDVGPGPFALILDGATFVLPDYDPSEGFFQINFVPPAAVVSA